MKSIHYFSTIAIITIIMGLIYVSVQQSYRTNANDPQKQIAHDLKEQIEAKGLDGQDFSDSVHLESSLAVFKTVYDEHGKPIRSTGYIGGTAPRLPAGVFDFVQSYGEDWITWQPRKDIRLATGILRVHAGPAAYLAVGRSLREVEERTTQLTEMIVAGWILCIAFVLIHALFDYNFNRKRKIA
jgi:hypothetical protein